MDGHRPAPTTPSSGARCACAFAGIVAPTACLVFDFVSRCHFLEWQSGRICDRVALLLAPEAVLPFLPLVLYAMVCMLLLLVSFGVFARLFFVRLGVYTGVMLTLQFALVWGISVPALIDGGTLSGPPLLFCAALAIGAPLCLHWLMAKVSRTIGKGRTVLLAAALIAGLWGCCVAEGVDPVEAAAALLAVGAIAVAWSVPFCAFAVYVWLASRLLLDAPSGRCGPGVVAGVASWLGCYLAAWRLAVREAHEIYASLPTTPPDCYVSTAAARGHPSVVKSERITTSNGTTFRVNTQMQRLKCAELGLMALAPRAHRVCRRTYDTVGPPLAAALRFAILADAAYVLLKPAEWAAIACLRALLPSVDGLVNRTYAADCPPGSLQRVHVHSPPFFAEHLCRAKSSVGGCKCRRLYC